MNIGALVKSIFLCGIVWLIVMCFGVANGLSFKFVIITILLLHIWSLFALSARQGKKHLPKMQNALGVV